MPESRLAGKVCVITGAGNGIGAATAELFAEHGPTAIVCADVDGAAAEAVAQRIVDAGVAASAFALDISDSSACLALIEHSVSTYGRLDVLHNNAGMGVLGAVHETSDRDWDRCLGVNLGGTFSVTKAALGPMLAQRRGAIINTCSTFATVGSPRLAAYHASKGAIRALTRQMARDYSPDIRVNSVSPGVVATNVTRAAAAAAADPVGAWKALEDSNHYFKRAAQPREIAFGILFLASDEASFITGHDLVISGGQGEVAF